MGSDEVAPVSPHMFSHGFIKMITIALFIVGKKKATQISSNRRVEEHTIVAVTMAY